MTRDRSLDIAVTGVSGRFAAARDVGELWAAVREGRVLTRRLDRAEVLAAGVPAELADDPSYVPVHGLLSDQDRFDHAFFGVSPREARLLDPQHRLLLECSWSALEDAGHPLGADPSPRTGVYAAASGSGHLRTLLAAGALEPPEFEEAILANERDFLATRIAYKLGLTGPALTVLTACSSSLAATHTAIQALNNGECDQALVVAASANAPQAGHLHLAGGVMSRSGRCRPFDAEADGTLAGSGAIGIVLRRYEDVEGASPPLYGVLLGSALTNDGSAKAGFLAPSAEGQEQAIRAALATAGVDASTVGYLESHGTGTSLGDPIEWSAATAAYGSLGAQPGTIHVGALKGTIGHLDAAAGLAGLVKALLVVEHGLIPPVPGLSDPNPLLEQHDTPLRLPRRAEHWTRPGPRRAAVSSFGVGGTNVHLLVEQAPRTTAPASPGRGPHLMVFSAKDHAAADRMRTRLADHMDHTTPALADVGHTLADRPELPYRSVAVAGTVEELTRELRTPAPKSGPVGAHPVPLVLLFPGQGTQVPGMARPFGAILPGFADALDRCLRSFTPDLAAEVERALHDGDFSAARLAETRLAQPALFAVEYAAGTALRALGPEPSALVGHSLGEISAAAVAGSLRLSAAARLVEHRGLLMQRCAAGAMLSLSCGESQARALIEEHGAELAVAAVNTAADTVVAGTPGAVAAFQAKTAGLLRTRALRADRAFHSPLIEPAAAALREALTVDDVQRAELAWVESANGRLLAGGSLVDAGHFARAARAPVRFAAALETVQATFPGAHAVEAGPGRVLSALAESAGLSATPLLASPAGPSGDRAVLAALGALWVAGLSVDLERLRPPGRPVRLPTYPFAGPRWSVPAAPPPPTPGPRETPVVPAQTAATALEANPDHIIERFWHEQLGVSDLPVGADFFQLGGDSLTVARLARGMSRVFGVDIPVRDLLAVRTVSGQTALVERLLVQQILDETGEGR